MLTEKELLHAYGVEDVRARLVRPEFWGDAKVGKLPARTRLTYIGLWNVADDAGYFEWEIEDIAFKLFGYEPADQREAMLEQDLQALTDIERIVRLPCGEHGFIPTLREWRIQGGTVNERVQQAHKREVPPSTAMYRSVSPSESLSESVSPSPPLRGPVKEMWDELGKSLGSKRQHDA